MSTAVRNKARGYEFEALLVRKAIAAGRPARRAWGSDGRALGLAADVDLVVGLPMPQSGIVVDRHVQAKKRKRLARFLQIPKSCDAVAIMQDYGETLVLVRYADWLSTELLGGKR